MEPYDNRKAAAEIESVPGPLLPAFVAACAERMMYPALPKQSGSEVAVGLRRLMVRLWEDARGDRMAPDEVAAAVDEALELVGQRSVESEADTLTLDTAALVVTRALQARQTEARSDALVCARAAYEAIASAAERRAALHGDEAFGKSMTAATVVQSEWVRQIRDIADLRRVSEGTVPGTVDRVRERARRVALTICERHFQSASRHALGDALAGVSGNPLQVALPFGEASSSLTAEQAKPRPVRPRFALPEEPPAASERDDAVTPLAFVRSQPATRTPEEVVAVAKAQGMTIGTWYVTMVRGQMSAREMWAKGEAPSIALPSRAAEKRDFVTARPEMPLANLLQEAHRAGLRMSADYVRRARGALGDRGMSGRSEAAPRIPADIPQPSSQTALGATLSRTLTGQASLPVRREGRAPGTALGVAGGASGEAMFRAVVRQALTDLGPERAAKILDEEFRAALPRGPT